MKLSQQLPLFLCFGCWMFLFQACSPEKEKDLGEPGIASFTISPVSGKPNTYALTSTSQNAFGYQWDKGNGTFAKGPAVDTAYFPLKGTYTVVLRAFGRGGYTESSQEITIEEDDIQNIPEFQMLTAHGWKLNPEPASIIVGTENNPAEYFGGGAMDPCQTDDVYTFSTDLTLTYNANGGTFNGGNIAPNFTCGTDRSYMNTTFGFTPGASGAGLATITMSQGVPARFIGVTDVSSNNYRIISISATEMVLRSGTASETVHQFKFIPE